VARKTLTWLQCLEIVGREVNHEPILAEPGDEEICRLLVLGEHPRGHFTRVDLLLGRQEPIAQVLDRRGIALRARRPPRVKPSATALYCTRTSCQPSPVIRLSLPLTTRAQRPK
jgi:hypothetical protein